MEMKRDEQDVMEMIRKRLGRYNESRRPQTSHVSARRLYESESDGDDDFQGNAAIKEFGYLEQRARLDLKAFKGLIKDRDTRKKFFSYPVRSEDKHLSGVFSVAVSERGYGDAAEPLTPLGKSIDQVLLKRKMVAFLEKREEKTIDDQLIEAAKTGNTHQFLAVISKFHSNNHQQQEESLGRIRGTEWSALTWASHFDHRLIATKLIQAGFAPNYTDNKGWSALMWAAHQNNIVIMKLLMDAGADPNHTNKYGTSALMWAAKQGNLKSVQLLATRGAKIDHENKEKSTALLWATKAGHADVVRFLVGRGASINQQNIHLENCLILAAESGHLELVQYLLKHENCDFTAKNRFSQTALDLAANWKSPNHTAIVNILKTLFDQLAEKQARQKLLLQQRRTELRKARLSTYKQN